MRRIFEFFLKDGGSSEHHGQRIVEFMCNTGQKLAKGRKFFRLVKIFLCALQLIACVVQFRHVDREAANFCDCAVVVLDRKYCIHHSHNAACHLSVILHGHGLPRGQKLFLHPVCFFPLLRRIKG